MMDKKIVLLLVALIGVSFFSVQASKPIAFGGQGKALYMDWRRSDVVSLDWSNAPTNAFTYESWVYYTNPYIDEQATFSYSVFDSSKMYEQANELVLLNSIKRTRLFRGAKGVDCKDCILMNSSSADQGEDMGWQHIAVSFNNSGQASGDGQVKFYINGALIHTYDDPADSKTDVSGLVSQGGVLHFGQEADAPWSNFDESQSFAGMVDEIRIWDYARSGQEIADNYQQSVDPTTSGLNIYWNFDQLDNSGDVNDISSSSHTGMMGRMPTMKNLMTWGTAKSAQPPTAPVLKYSHVPFEGTGARYLECSPSVACTIDISVSCDQTVTFNLASTPGAGTTVLENVDGTAGTATIKYTPASDFSSDVTIQWTATSSGNHVSNTQSITVTSLVNPTPPDVSLDINEDVLSKVELGNMAMDGQRLYAVVESLPAKGKLYQVGFSGTPAYGNLEQDTSKLVEITAANTVVDNLCGVLMYKPDEHGFTVDGGEHASFQYSWTKSLSNADESSLKGKVSIKVAAVNDAPTGIHQDIGSSASGETVTLTMQDPDTNFSPHPFYRISSWPTNGKLYQVNADGTKGDMIAEKTRVPIVYGYAEKILAASSQYSRCGESCYENIFCECHTDAWHASVLVGEPDVYPNYGDYVQAWSGKQENDVNGEWYVAQFADEVYPSLVEIFETFKIGATTEISYTTSFDGDNTNWITMWQGPVQGDGMGQEAKVFAPPTCPATAKSNTIRVKIDTSIETGIAGWNEHDALKLNGPMEFPPGLVAHTGGKIMYVPNDGIHCGASCDDISFYTTDCENESPEAQTISITSIAQGSSVKETFSQTVDQNKDTEIFINTTSYGSSSTVTIQAIGDDKTKLKSSSGTVLAASDTLSGTKFVVHPEADAKSFDVSVWVTDSSSITHRLKYSFDILCSDSFYARNTDGQCVVCDAITDAQKNSFTEIERLRFEEKCVVVFSQSDSIHYAMWALAGVEIALVLVLLILLIKFQSHKVMKASSPKFLMLILLGCIVELLIIFMDDMDDFGCSLRWWCAHIGFCLVFGALFAKTHRLSKIFNNAKLRAMRISDNELFSILAGLLFVVCVYMVVWTVVDPPLAKSVRYKDIIVTECKSDDGFWSTIPIICEVIFVLWGAYLAFKTRNTPSAYNESKWIGVCLYNTVFVGLVCIALSLFFPEDPDFIYAIQSVGIFFISSAVLVGIFFTKFWVIKYGHSAQVLSVVSSTEATVSDKAQSVKS